MARQTGCFRFLWRDLRRLARCGTVAFGVCGTACCNDPRLGPLCERLGTVRRGWGGAEPRACQSFHGNSPCAIELVGYCTARYAERGPILQSSLIQGYEAEEMTF